MKPLIVDLPYPSIENVQKNLRDARVIAPAYAGHHGEATAIFQYVYHHFYFEKYLQEDIAKTLMCISLAEMEHLEILGSLLLKLGADPVFTVRPPYRFNPYSTAFVKYGKEPQKMLLEDISSELTAIADYEKMLPNLIDENVSALISRIILDEQLHVQALKKALEQISR